MASTVTVVSNSKELVPVASRSKAVAQAVSRAAVANRTIPATLRTIERRQAKQAVKAARVKLKGPINPGPFLLLHRRLLPCALSGANLLTC